MYKRVCIWGENAGLSRAGRRFITHLQEYIIFRRAVSKFCPCTSLTFPQKKYVFPLERKNKFWKKLAGPAYFHWRNFDANPSLFGGGGGDTFFEKYFLVQYVWGLAVRCARWMFCEWALYGKEMKRRRNMIGRWRRRKYFWGGKERETGLPSLDTFFVKRYLIVTHFWDR